MAKAARDHTRPKPRLQPDDMQNWVSVHEAVKRFLDEAKFGVRVATTSKNGGASANKVTE